MAFIFIEMDLRDYQISQSIITIQSDTLQVNELKFANAVFCCTPKSDVWKFWKMD